LQRRAGRKNQTTQIKRKNARRFHQKIEEKHRRLVKGPEADDPSEEDLFLTGGSPASSRGAYRCRIPGWGWPNPKTQKSPKATAVQGKECVGRANDERGRSRTRQKKKIVTGWLFAPSVNSSQASELPGGDNKDPNPDDRSMGN